MLQATILDLKTSERSGGKDTFIDGMVRSVHEVVWKCLVSVFWASLGSSVKWCL